MNILFIYRDKHYNLHNFREIFSKNLCKYDFGFLLVSLKTFANVEVISLRNFIQHGSDKSYDHVVIVSKIRIDYSAEKFLLILKQKIKSTVSIFLSLDMPIKLKDVIEYEKNLDVANYFVPNLLK
tara:strand:+ start:1546 stop:1920 length:375 start_codon:yes stop_codon:yes gene_type:complete